MGRIQTARVRLLIGGALAASLVVGAISPMGVQARQMRAKPATITETGNLFLEPAPAINPTGINHVIGAGSVTITGGITGTDTVYRNEYPAGTNGCVAWQGGGTFTAASKVDGFEWVGTGTDCVTSTTPVKLSISGTVVVANGFGKFKGEVSTGRLSGNGTLAASAPGMPLTVPYTVTIRLASL